MPTFCAPRSRRSERRLPSTSYRGYIQVHVSRACQRGLSSRALARPLPTSISSQRDTQCSHQASEHQNANAAERALANHATAQKPLASRDTSQLAPPVIITARNVRRNRQAQKRAVLHRQQSLRSHGLFADKRHEPMARREQCGPCATHSQKLLVGWTARAVASALLSVMQSQDHAIVRLGAAVRQRRKGLGLTQEAVARAAGCGLVFVYNLERGKPSLRLDKLLNILRVLGMDIVVTLREPGESPLR